MWPSNVFRRSVRRKRLVQKYLRNTPLNFNIEHLADAAALIREELKDFPPIKVKLAKFSYFVFPKSCMLFLDPETEPADAIQTLSERMLKLFPQCNDTIKRSGKFVPHISIGRFKNERDCMNYKHQLEKKWQPLEFTLKEIYLLYRNGIDPFEVQHVVSLGSDVTPSYFGPSSRKNDENKTERTVVICSLPKGLKDSELMDLMNQVKLFLKYNNL